MQLHELPWGQLLPEYRMRLLPPLCVRCQVRRADGCIVDILRDARGETYSIYLDSNPAAELGRWVGVDPITAQAVLHHLLSNPEG